MAARLATAVRAFSLGASPLSAAVARRWIDSGLAMSLLASIRQESQWRRSLAERLLSIPEGGSVAGGFHLWLSLPEDWPRLDFVAHLRRHGILLAASDAFAVGIDPPEAVRLCLGTLSNRSETERLLIMLRDLLLQTPERLPSVV